MVYGRTMDVVTTALGPLGGSYQETLESLARFQFTTHLWSRRVDMWTQDPAVQQKIANRLGWLDALAVAEQQLDRARACAASVRADGFTHVVLLGMGGSSLAPEVMRQVLGVAPGFPRFQMLDSVDPESVAQALTNIPQTLFVFASKSGGTIEPNAMAAEAVARLTASGVKTPGARFIAITDEGTALHKKAVADGFRDIFVNPSDIGGRFSALSLFGLVPAALMGADLDAFLGHARRMADACRRAEADNPGVVLGAFMAAAARSGRDKLTLLLPPSLASLGLWIEQLVAESTGKDGVGVVPIAGESRDVVFGPDRAAVVVHLGSESPDPTVLATLRNSGTPFLEWRVEGPLALGAEFFRWEIATAAAGRALGVNPFDEPNVQQAKDATKTLLDIVAATGSLPSPAVDFSADGFVATLSAAAWAGLGDPRDFLSSVGSSDYVSIMAFLPTHDPALGDALDDLRASVGRATGKATMLGFGPRYLHSTGQLHKGGGRNGVFLILTASPALDMEIPGAGYSFGTLERAQALGDFNSLNATGRRAMFVQLPTRSPDAIRALGRLLASGSAPS